MHQAARLGGGRLPQLGQGPGGRDDAARREVLIGGPAVCDGYLVDPENPDPDIIAKNKEDFVTIDGMRHFV